MAWFAQIDSPASAVGDHVMQAVNYYDDAVLDKNGLPSLVYATTLSFPLGSNVTEKTTDFQSSVIATGQNARKASAIAAQLAAQSPVGTKIVIP